MEENTHINKVHDEIIRENVIDKLRNDPGLDAVKIEVEVKNAIVALKGKVDTEKEKLLSEKIAQSVEGVSSVENHLHIEVGIIHALSSLAAHIQGDIIKDDDKEEKKK